MFAEASKNASALLCARTVAAPAASSSNRAAVEKSVGTAVMAAIRAASAAVRGMMFRCGSSSGPAKAKGPIRHAKDAAIKATSFGADDTERINAQFVLKRVNYWNTAFGSSKLSDPSIAMPSSPRAVTTCSIDRV